MAPTRILYLAGGPEGTNVYGAERSVLDLVAGMDRRQCRPCGAVVQGDGPYAGALRDLGVPVSAVRFHPDDELNAGSLPAAVRCVQRLARIARRARPDVIHVNSLRLNPYGVLVGRALGVPVICYVQGHVSRRAYFTRLAFGARMLVACSESVAAPWRRMAWPNGRLRVAYYGIDPEPFAFSEERRRKERARLRLSDDTFALGVVSRLSPSKKLESLFEALRLAAAKGARVVAFIAGDAPACWHDYGEGIRRLPERMGIGREVVFLDYVSNISSLYSAFDVVIAPSDEEGLGRVPLEAMAASRPVIAMRAGGPVETMVHGETGLLVPPQDPEALAAATIELARDRALRRRLGEAGRRRIEERFTLAGYVLAFERMYEELTAKKGAAKCRASLL